MSKRIVIAFVSLVLLLHVASAAQSAMKTGLQSLPGDNPRIAKQDPNIAYDFNLAQEKFFISVPKNYTGAQPFGLFVFLSPSDDSSSLPPGWGAVLESKKLIFISPQNVGNAQLVSRRAGLAIVAAYKLREMENIDTNRVYISGFSGGARIASYVAFVYPDVFAGAFAICGVNFARKVDRVKATEKDDYGYFTFDAKRAETARQKVKFVLVTGSKDFRYGNILDVYNGGFVKDGYDVRLIDVPEMGHAMCPAKVLADGLSFLDMKREDRPPKK